MGSIVSSRKQMLSQNEVYPSEIYAQEAKHRQAALKGLHLPLVRKLSRKDAFDLSSASDEDDIREWYPAGVTPWYYNEETGVLVMPRGDWHWMDGMSISAMELHRAAIIIQRVIRGYQTRKSLIRENEGATKIQRTYRSYKRKQSAKLLGAGMAPSYLKTFRISDSVVKGTDSSLEDDVIWSAEGEHEKAKNQSGAVHNNSNARNVSGNSRAENSSNLAIIQEEDHKEILTAVEVPIQSNADVLQSSMNYRKSETRRQNLASYVGARQSLVAGSNATARREELAMAEKDITFKSPIPQHVTAARQSLIPTLTPGQNFVTTSMQTWTPEASYSNPVSADSGLGRFTESRESEKSVFSSHPSVRVNGLSNGPMGSLPSLKPSMRGSLPGLKESNPSLQRPSASGSELRSNLSSQEGNPKSLQDSTETNTTPFRLTRTWPLAVQIKPDLNDVQEIAKALENRDTGSHLGIGGSNHSNQETFSDAVMHPAMYASNALKATVRKAGRYSTPNHATKLMKEGMMRKSEETPKFTGDPISTVNGTNYQKLMKEMRQQRLIEKQQKEAERAAARKAKEESGAVPRSSSKMSSISDSHLSVTSRTQLQPQNGTFSSTRDSVSIASNKKNKSVVKEDENNTSFVPQLSIITEDKTCDKRNTLSIKEQDICPVPSQSSNTLSVPNNNQNLLKMDPLIKMLYQEISESNEETINDRSRNDSKGVESGQGGEGNEGEAGEKKGEGEGEDKEIELTPELIERVRTAIIKRQLSKEGSRSTLVRGSSKEMESPVEIYGKDSILIAPPDVETLLKAAEFRGAAIKKLKHLTTAIRLDYHEFINSVEQTLFYAAQRVEASLENYHPPTVLLISSSVPKYKILRNSAKPGVLAHVYDFSSSLTDLLNDIAQLLENFRPGAKAKNLGIVCKGGPGYFYLARKCPVTPAKLRNRDEILQFWQGLGHHMSKLHPGQSVIHMMESNVAGNRQGENLLSDLEAALYSHQVKVASPLEMAPSGREMLNIYFDPRKHKLWKMMRYTKLRLYK